MPAASRTTLARRLAGFRAGKICPRAVIGRFLRDGDVMRMALLHTCRAHQNEAGPRAQLLNVASATVAHACPQSAYQLVDERRQWTLVRHSPLDSLGNQLVPRGGILPVAVLRAGHHGAERTHSPIG